MSALIRQNYFCIIILLHLLQSCGSVINYEVECSTLRMGQYICPDPDYDYIDLKTQQPRGCTKENKAKVICKAADGIICLETKNSTFRRDIPCKWTNGYSFETAMLLSIFLGMFGADRFYLGYPALGLLKFCTLGFMFLGQLVDVILIATQIVGPADGSHYVVPYFGVGIEMANLVKDVTLNDSHPNELMMKKHIEYIAAYGNNKDEYEYCMTEYLRMSGMYWGLTAMDMMGQLSAMDWQQVTDFVLQCVDESGGIGASPGHDPHLLYTLSAVQILCLLDAINILPVERVVQYVVSLQQPDGSFTGDKWGEVDTRFSFCAVATLSLIGRLDAIDVEKAMDFVLSCHNFDGGFGSRPGSESHAGLIYCCLGFLSIIGRLDRIDGDLLGWWLAERQLQSGGLNGRPEKLPDVCYSWWVLASLAVLGRLHWVNKQALQRFILACQDSEVGGFSDRPGDLPDPFHTLFGLAALSLLGNDSLAMVNATYCMPQRVIDRLKLSPQVLTI